MGHGTIFVYSILSVTELSEVLWDMVLYLYTVSCLRCCGAWYYICIQYSVWGVVGHGTIFVYSILSVLELSEVLWGMVLYLYTVSCLLQNCLRCCGAWYYICIQYPVCSRTV